MNEQDYLNYKLQVEPPMMAVMAQVVADAASFGVTEDQVNRAVYRWIIERLSVTGSLPEWYFEELDEIAQLKEQNNE